MIPTLPHVEIIVNVLTIKAPIWVQVGFNNNCVLFNKGFRWNEADTQLNLNRAESFLSCYFFSLRALSRENEWKNTTWKRMNGNNQHLFS